jgi:hypothetical protein
MYYPSAITFRACYKNLRPVLESAGPTDAADAVGCWLGPLDFGLLAGLTDKPVCGARVIYAPISLEAEARIKPPPPPQQQFQHPHATKKNVRGIPAHPPGLAFFANASRT